MIAQAATPAQQSMNNVFEDYHHQGSVLVNDMSALHGTGQESLTAAASFVSTTSQGHFTIGQQDMLQFGQQLGLCQLGQILEFLFQRPSLRETWETWHRLYEAEVADVHYLFGAEFAPRSTTSGWSPMVEGYMARLQLYSHEASSRASRAALEATLRGFVFELHQAAAGHMTSYPIVSHQSREDALEGLLEQQIIEMQDRQRQRDEIRVEENAVSPDVIAVLANENMEDLGPGFNEDLGAGFGDGGHADMGM